MPLVRHCLSRCLVLKIPRILHNPLVRLSPTIWEYFPMDLESDEFLEMMAGLRGAVQA